MIGGVTARGHPVAPTAPACAKFVIVLGRVIVRAAGVGAEDAAVVVRVLLLLRMLVVRVLLLLRMLVVFIRACEDDDEIAIGL